MTFSEFTFRTAGLQTQNFRIQSKTANHLLLNFSQRKTVPAPKWYTHTHTHMNFVPFFCQTCDTLLVHVHRYQLCTKCHYLYSSTHLDGESFILIFGVRGSSLKRGVSFQSDLEDRLSWPLLTELLWLSLSRPTLSLWSRLLLLSETALFWMISRLIYNNANIDKRTIHWNQ